MSVKLFRVNVELEIQAVSCPGVWLCPNGKVFLKVHIFDRPARTCSLDPVFPLLYHQKFTFQKNYTDVHNLADLQCLLSKENLYAELNQCSGSQCIELATYQGSLFELLYPSPCMKKLIAGVDVNLLMEPAKCFPGILSPKIELSTKTTIDEDLDSTACKRDPAIINPKMLSSKGSTIKTASQKNLKYNSPRHIDTNNCNCKQCCRLENNSLTRSISSSDIPCVCSSVPEDGCRSPRSCYDIFKDSLKLKHRKQKKETNIVSPCYVEKKEYHHKTCTCDVCRMYLKYFHKKCNCKHLRNLKI